MNYLNNNNPAVPTYPTKNKKSNKTKKSPLNTIRMWTKNNKLPLHHIFPTVLHSSPIILNLRRRNHANNVIPHRTHPKQENHSHVYLNSNSNCRTDL